MKKSGICALCKRDRILKESHIIPKFIGKWLKQTSVTGYFRNTLEPNRRAQDITKQELLCGECEQKFSNFEKQFAEKIFKPFHEGCQSFTYDEWLIKAIISIQWRIILNRKDTISGMSEELLHHLDISQELFRQYLNDEREDYGDYSHHIFFLDTIESLESDIFGDRPNMYFLRSIDVTIASNGNSTSFIYTKLPGIIINSHITPTNMKGWHNTLINKEGTITFPQLCEVEGYGDFLGSRIKESRNYDISDNQQQKIEDSFKNNSNKFEESKTFIAVHADSNLKR